jgi:hypothetical protein
MNVKRGLWRAWIFISVLWVLGAVLLSASMIPSSFAKKYSYIYQMRSDVPDPNKVDWTKNFYDLMQSPSSNMLSSTFDVVSYSNGLTWDEDVKKGTLISAEFPDNSKLYLSAQMTKDDQNYVAKQFWNQRWWRYGSDIIPFAAWTVAPPIVLLIIGSFLVWVVRGFARD